MQFIQNRPEELELKYNKENLNLIWEYIGNTRTHGDVYYDDKFLWYECIPERDDAIYTNGEPGAVICITENRHLPFSLHLSLIEVFTNKKGDGVGTFILNKLIEIATSMKFKVITLQIHNKELISFYQKFGFSERIINNCPIMRKYL